MQHLVLHSSLLTQALNVFYATVHFPAMIGFLIWMFIRHRDNYPQVRNTVVLVTGAALAIQLIPVAPPRLTPGLGFVDTRARCSTSRSTPAVGTPGPDQLSAMPSVHVAWSLLVALGVVVFSTSRWRWWIVAHPFVTILAVVATGNHWWFDGIVAAWLIGLSIVVERSAARRRRRHWAGASCSSPRCRSDVAIPVALPRRDVRAERFGFRAPAVEEHPHETRIERVGEHVVERERVERVVQRARQRREALRVDRGIETGQRLFARRRELEILFDAGRAGRDEPGHEQMRVRRPGRRRGTRSRPVSPGPAPMRISAARFM